MSTIKKNKELLNEEKKDVNIRPDVREIANNQIASKFNIDNKELKPSQKKIKK